MPIKIGKTEWVFHRGTAVSKFWPNKKAQDGAEDIAARDGAPKKSYPRLTRRKPPALPPPAPASPELKPTVDPVAESIKELTAARQRIADLKLEIEKSKQYDARLVKALHHATENRLTVLDRVTDYKEIKNKLEKILASDDELGTRAPSEHGSHGSKSGSASGSQSSGSRKFDNNVPSLGYQRKPRPKYLTAADKKALKDSGGVRIQVGTQRDFQKYEITKDERFPELEAEIARAKKTVSTPDLSRFLADPDPRVRGLAKRVDNYRKQVLDAIDKVEEGSYDKVSKYRKGAGKLSKDPNAAPEGEEQFRKYGVDYFKGRMEAVMKDPEGEPITGADGFPKTSGIFVDNHKGIKHIVTKVVQEYLEMKGGSSLINFDEPMLRLARSLSPDGVSAAIEEAQRREDIDERTVGVAGPSSSTAPTPPSATRLSKLTTQDLDNLTLADLRKLYALNGILDDIDKDKEKTKGKEKAKDQ